MRFEGAVLVILAAVTLCTASSQFSGGWPAEYVDPAGKSRSFGSRRAVVNVECGQDLADIVEVTIEWRRWGDIKVHTDVRVVYGNGYLPVKSECVTLSKEVGVVNFVPLYGPGEYQIYYLPFTWEDKEFSASIKYDKLGSSSYSCVKSTVPQPKKSVLKVTVPASMIQYASAFDTAKPMELVATQAEIESYVKKIAPAKVGIFPEDRSRPIRVLTQPLAEWMTNCRATASPSFAGTAKQGEYYAFQLGVFAVDSVRISKLEFRDLSGGSGNAIDHKSLHCFNCEGVDYWQRPFTRDIHIAKGSVQPIWITVDIPTDMKPDTYKGSISIAFDLGNNAGGEMYSVDVEIMVVEGVISRRGDIEPWRMSRLRWFDSVLGHEADTPTYPFSRIEQKSSDDEISVNGSYMSARIDKNSLGLPREIHVGPFEHGKKPIGLLSAPVAMDILANGKDESLKCSMLKLAKSTPELVSWSTKAEGGHVQMILEASIDYTGRMEFTSKIIAKSEVSADVSLRVSVPRDIAVYLMGLGRKGGKTASAEWKWDGKNGNNRVWLGKHDAGLYIKLKGDDDSWDASVMYDQVDLMHDPPHSWHNGGLGGASIKANGDQSVQFIAYSGKRDMKVDESVDFKFVIMTTPARPISTDRFEQRIDHLMLPTVDTVYNWTAIAETGASIVTIHQGSWSNPYINYPYLTRELLSEVANGIHEAGMQFKIYNTMRELSVMCAEMWAARSANETYLSEGPQGGSNWLQEHLGAGYSPAWSTPLGNGFMDVAIKTVGLSRWNNYYVEGIRYLVEEHGLDGIYLDEVAYDSATMRRVRRVFDSYTKAKRRPLIDMHSHQGAFCLSPALNYMELFPYIDSTWLGEGFDYENSSPEYWLVEISAIPFGLHSDMLVYNDNPGYVYRGLLVGMANRRQDNNIKSDPRYIWSLWDKFGISHSKMIGWFEESGHPVSVKKCDNVLVSTYLRKGHSAMVVLASWSDAKESCVLSYDTATLGFTPTTLKVPEIPNLQTEATLRPNDAIEIEKAPTGGIIVILEHDGWEATQTGQHLR